MPSSSVPKLFGVSNWYPLCVWILSRPAASAFSPSASTSTLCTVRVVTGAVGEKLEPWFVRCIQPFCTATFAYR